MAKRRRGQHEEVKPITSPSLTRQGRSRSNDETITAAAAGGRRSLRRKVASTSAKSDSKQVSARSRRSNALEAEDPLEKPPIGNSDDLIFDRKSARTSSPAPLASAEVKKEKSSQPAGGQSSSDFSNPSSNLASDTTASTSALSDLRRQTSHIPRPRFASALHPPTSNEREVHDTDNTLPTNSIPHRLDHHTDQYPPSLTTPDESLPFSSLHSTNYRREKPVGYPSAGMASASAPMHGQASTAVPPRIPMMMDLRPPLHYTQPYPMTEGAPVYTANSHSSGLPGQYPSMVIESAPMYQNPSDPAGTLRRPAPPQLPQAQDFGSEIHTPVEESQMNVYPQLRMLPRNAYEGADSSSTSSLEPMSTTQEKGKGHRSRFHLQKQYRQLQDEMNVLKQQIKDAGADQIAYAPSPLNASTSGDRYDVGNGTGAYYQDAQGSYYRHPTTFVNEPAAAAADRAQRGSTSYDSTDRRLRLSQASNTAQYPIGYPSAPSAETTDWRIGQYNGGNAPSLSSSIPFSAPGGRRGTWKTIDGNVLVFNSASNAMERRQAPSSPSSRLHGGDATLDYNDSSRSTSGSLLGRGGYGEESFDAAEDEGEEEEEPREGDPSKDANRRYQCLLPGCDKTFTTSGHARRHSRTHLGHKLFLCPHEGCGSTFTRRDNCRQHQRARHRSTLPIQESSEIGSLEDMIGDRSSRQQHGSVHPPMHTATMATATTSTAPMAHHPYSNNINQVQQAPLGYARTSGSALPHLSQQRQMPPRS